MEKSNLKGTNGYEIQQNTVHIPSNLVLLALSDIKLAHTVFALPFALLAAVMAAPVLINKETRGPDGSAILFGDTIDWRRLAGQLGLVLACMFFARTWAMLVNRLADRGFDRDNPRTERRVFASGRLGARQGWAVALGCAAAFVACCGLFWVFFGNAWPLWLSVPVLGWIALYSYTKRFTWLCHLFLGGALAASPIAAAIAVNPEVIFSVFNSKPQSYFPPTVTVLTETPGPAILLLAGFVLLWVAGFDVAYALQDIDFDRRTGLHSIPARLGVKGALWVSRGLHAGAFAFLVAANFPDTRLGYLFSVATLGVGAILVFEHIVLARRGVAGLPLAFFTLNGIVSCVLGAAGIVDVVV